MQRRIREAAEAVFRCEAETRKPAWALAPLVAVVLAAAVALARVGNSINTVYAEDGVQFYPDERNRGFFHVILAGFSGYLHLGPRVITLVAAALPLRDLALGFSVSCAVVTGLVTALTGRALAAYGVGRTGGFVLSLLIPLAPIALFECLDAAANIQWLLAAGCFWAMVWAPVEKRWLAASSVLVLVSAGSAPLVLVYLPIALLRLVALRGRQRLVPVAYLVGAALQVYTMLHSTRTGITHPSSVVDLLKTTATRLLAVTWLGTSGAHGLFDQIGSKAFLLIAAFWVIVLAACVATFRSAWIAVLAVVFGTALFLAGTLNNYATTTIAGTRGFDVNIVDNGRYANSPSVILATGAICALAIAARHRRIVIPVLVAAVALLSVSVVVDFRYAIPRDSAVSWDTALTTAAATCRATGARDVSVAIAPAGYSTSLSCTDVLASR